MGKVRPNFLELKNPIIGVAFQSKNKLHTISLLKPKRHCDLFEWIHNNIKGLWANQSWVQGFITIEGDFLNRRDAADHAAKIGQCEPEYEGSLFSEDLW